MYKGRRLYREYLKYLGCDVKSLIKVEDKYYEEQVVHYLDSSSKMLTESISVKRMLLWVIKNKNIKFTLD